MFKKLLCVVLIFSSIISFSSCTQELEELSEAERIEQMISDIGTITKYDEATKIKVEEAITAYNNYINNLDYPTQSEIDTTKVDELKNLLFVQATYNYAKSLIDVTIFDIKSRLYHPSSFELNLLTLEVYEHPINETKSEYFFSIYVDYSAQNRAGGYTRDTIKAWESEFVYRSTSANLELPEIYTKTSSPYKDPTFVSLAQYFAEKKYEGYILLTMAKSDITWTLE